MKVRSAVVVLVTPPAVERICTTWPPELRGSAVAVRPVGVYGEVQAVNVEVSTAHSNVAFAAGDEKVNGGAAVTVAYWSGAESSEKSGAVTVMLTVASAAESL